MKRRLLILQDTLAGGGAERALIEILSRIDYTRLEVDLLLYARRGELLPLVPREVRVMSLYPRGTKSPVEKVIYHTPLREAYERKKLLALAGGRRWDVVLSFMEGPGAKMHSNLPGYGLKNVTWVHTNMAVNKWSLQFFRDEASERAFYESVDEVVHVSEDIEAVFPYRCAKVRSRVIPNVIDVRKNVELAGMRRRRTAGDRFRLCYVGRFEALKRPERFVETVGLLKALGRDVEGVMLGEGSLRKKVEEQVLSLGLERDVELIGFVKNPYPYIGGSDVLVVPSDTEGLSIVTLEALSIGVPVVSTNCTGPAGILKQGGGLLADMTAESLADKVERIMDDGDLRVRLEAEGPRVAEQYSPERVMNLFYDLVENGPERESGSNT